jgi:chorismate--pyruvate lyase
MPTRTPRWQPPRALAGLHVPEGLRSWLFEEGSLTRRLRAHCPKGFDIQVVSSAWGRALPDERRVLDLPAGRTVLVRQVYLRCGLRPLVYARTVIPPRSLHGANQRLARLGPTPLSAVLFGPGTTGRRRLEVARLGPEHVLYHLAGPSVAPGVLWARRSIFLPAGRPVLVTEVFLPALGGF